MGNQRHTAAFVAGIVMGSAAGMAYGWLNAPGRGADARASVAEIWNDLLELGAEAVAEADNQVRSRLTGEEPARTLPILDQRPAIERGPNGAETMVEVVTVDGVEGGVEPADA